MVNYSIKKIIYSSMFRLLFLFFILCYNILVISYPIIKYDINSPSLRSIQIQNNSSQFYPSNYGGIGVVGSKGDLFNPWSQDVKFKLLKSNNDSYAEWLMYKENDFYYHYSIEFQKNGGNELIIHMKDLGEINDVSLPKYYATAYALYLDRCENALNPVIISVPYLTMFNVLFANDCFVSIYFDWNKINASQIVVNNKSFSQTSKYFANFALYNPLINGKRNKLDETIILKVSDNFDNVLPDLSNPISKYKEESSKRILFDDWDPFNKSYFNVEKISQNGMKNIWHIVHNWQKSGYDVALPDVFPANSLYGGNEKLIEVSNLDRQLGSLFSLHENYIDIYTKSSKYVNENLALNPEGKYIFNWFNGDTSYVVKPTRIFKNLVPVSTQIHDVLQTNASFIDVSAANNPSKYVDYDYHVDGAGKFITVYNTYKSIADTLRKIHGGPVSSEGSWHFLYVGYYDDISTASIQTGAYVWPETEGGFYKPLLVDFDLLRMKEKTMVHGVGYYERFFLKNNYWQYLGRSKDSALIYSATELAYGHGTFFSTLSYNFIEQGSIEYNYIYPIQLLYADSKVSKILYNDNGDLINASDYIRKYPNTFDKFGNDDFMSQVYIEYDNGLKIYVNRNTNKKWSIDFQGQYGFYSTHSFFDGKDSLYVGNMSGKRFILPENNGWLCYYSKK